MRVPTLFIGLGGIGCQIVAQIDDLLTKEDKEYVSLVGIDTDGATFTKYRDKHRDMVLVQTSDEYQVKDYLDRHPECKSWFPDQKILQLRKMSTGAGQVRALSRLTCYASAANGKFQPILNEITRIRRINSNTINSGLTVVFVGSITGGTGAGLFIQMPFFIRKHILTKAGLNSCVVRGMFIGPDITEEVQDYDFNKQAVRVNGYTCLKELNAFYLHHEMDDEHASNLNVDFFDNTNKSTENVPYDYMYLFEKVTTEGGVGDASLEEVIEYVSRIAFGLIFTPISSKSNSMIDNDVLDRINNNGMNRYCGAGICRLVFPREIAQRYVCLSVAKRLVETQWTLIDQKFKQIHRAAENQRATDYTIKLPEISKSFVELFEDEVIGEGKHLADLANDAYDFDSKGTAVPKSKKIIDTIDKRVADLMASGAIESAEAACKVDVNEMKTFNNAGDHIDAVWSAMKSLVAVAENTVKDKPYTYANDLFPVDSQTMMFVKDNPACIYNLLANAHPVAARFLMYDLINRLEAKIASEEKEAVGLNLRAYLETDFDPKTPEIEDAAKTLETIQEKRGFLKKIFVSEASDINKLAINLRAAADQQVATAHAFIEHNVKIALCKILLERITNLASKYKIFFDTITDKINANDTELQNLEEYRFPIGQIGVYSSPRALQKMSQEYFAENSVKMTDDTKRKVFEEVFFILADEYGKKKPGYVESSEEKEIAIRDTKEKLENVYAEAILDTITSDVIENGAGVVNLTILEALRKEQELVAPKTNVDVYIKERVQEAINKATPMLLVDDMDSTAAMHFIALSPACAKKNASGGVDVPQTQAYYLPASGYTIHTVVEEEFCDTEITCMQLKHNYLIEQLVKYMPGVDNSDAYARRMSSLNCGYRINTDISEVTVNPHLDRNWNEEAFIPAIEPKQRIIDKMNCVKAFIYGLALGKLECKKDEDNVDINGNARLRWFAKYDTGNSLIYKLKRPIGNGYYDLYNSIQYNGRIKRMVLGYAATKLPKDKEKHTVNELDQIILELDFVKSLIHEGQHDSKVIHKRNILDIIYEMKPYMTTAEWNLLFDGLYEIVYDYCSTLFDGNNRLIRNNTKSILQSIYDASAIAAKEKVNVDDLSIDEEDFVNRYNQILSNVVNMEE